MEIEIRRRLFQNDPAVRFSRKFNCSPNVWREVWKRYKFLEYTEHEAHEYLSIVLKIPIRSERFKRWICRTEIYTRAQAALKDGKKQVPHEYFKPFHIFVCKQITKNDKV